MKQSSDLWLAYLKKEFKGCETSLQSWQVLHFSASLSASQLPKHASGLQCQSDLHVLTLVLDSEVPLALII